MGDIHPEAAKRTMLEPTQIIYLNPRDLLPSQPSVRSDPGDLAGLAETIREHGILQPLGVTPEDDTSRIVYGNRRRDAAIVVGLDRVPCVLVAAGSARRVIHVRQLALFGGQHPLIDRLRQMDVNALSPIEALTVLYQLQKDAHEP